MKKKIIQVPNANVRVESTETGLTKVSVSEGYFGDVRWEFYVPQSTRDKFGFVPSEIVKSRMMRDFGVQLGHYSTTLAK